MAVSNIFNDNIPSGNMSQMLLHFKKIRHIATINCQNALSDIDEIKNQFKDELEKFWDGVESFLVSGRYEYIHPVIEQWIRSQPWLNNPNHDYSLLNTIHTIFQELWRTFYDELDNESAIKLMVVLFPLVGQANQQIARYEIDRSTNEIKSALKETQSNLEFIEKSKSKFIRIAAHELKTPLTIINGYTSMMNEIITNEQTQLQEMIKGIDAGTRRMKTIVQDLIDVSLIDNRLLRLSLQPVWLDRIFETLKWEIADTIKKRDLSFQIEEFDGINRMIFSDPDRLLQVFRNIISNAIKYTPDGGRIIITGRELPGFIEVVVNDTGIGIAPENQMLIFEKFIQFGETSTHSSSKTKYLGGGPGLGLHITKGILETMGGTIWAESPGFDQSHCPGSSFHVLIPRDQQPMKDNLDHFIRQ